MFFIDAGTNRLGLNTLAPAVQFHFLSDGRELVLNLNGTILIMTAGTQSFL